MALVAAFVLRVRFPSGFFRVNLREGAGHVRFPLDRIKNEEFWFWTEVSNVADAGSFQVSLSTLRERAWVTVVTLAGGRLDHVAGDVERRLFDERIDHSGVWIGHQQHVGGFNAFPTGDGRAVERVAFYELVVRELVMRHLNVLLFAAEVGEAKVNEADFFVFDFFEYVGSSGHAISPKQR